MKSKSKKWIEKSIGFGNNNEDKRIFSSSFVEPLSRISGDESGYHVVAKNNISIGQTIEEIPALILHSSTIDMESSDFDPILREYSVSMNFPEKTFIEEGFPLVLGLGNFLLYGKSATPNAEYIFDRTFNTFIIRAIKSIQPGEKINFVSSTTEKVDQPIASDPAPKQKKKGGCGKKNKKQEAIEQAMDSQIQEIPEEIAVDTPDGMKPSILDYPVSANQGWNELPKELKQMVAERIDDKKDKETKSMFRSMVDGTPLNNND